MVTWQGPDILNLLGISELNLGLIKDSKQLLMEMYKFVKAYKNEIMNRELIYYKQLLF